jgi:fatty acid desaturase
MKRRSGPDLDEELRKFERRLPNGFARFVRWLRQPSSRWVRIPAALLLVLGGAVGFLPILGFWMVPLGLVLVAVDIPFLRPPMARLLAWIEKKWPARGHASPARSR